MLNTLVRNIRTILVIVFLMLIKNTSFCQGFINKNKPSIIIRENSGEKYLRWIIEEGEYPLSAEDLDAGLIKDAKLIDLETSKKFEAKVWNNYWFNIELEHVEDLSQKSLSFERGGNCWPFEVTFYSVEAYQCHNDSMTLIGVSGNSIPANRRDTPNHISPSIIMLKNFDAKTSMIWIKIVSAEACKIQIDIALNDNSEILERKFDQKIMITLPLLGAIVALLLILSYLIYKFKDEIYVWSSFYLLILFINRIYVGLINEFYRFLNFENPRIFVLSYAIIATLLMVSFLQVWRKLINTFNEFPKVYRFIGYLIIYICLFSMIFTSARFVRWDFSFFTPMQQPLFLLFFVLISIIAAYLIFKGTSVSRFISLGIVVMSFSITVAIILVNYFTAVDEVLLKGIIGVAMVFVLVAALAHRFVIIHNQKEAALVEKIEAEKQNIDQLHKINSASNKFVPNAFLNFIGKSNILEATLGDHIEKNVAILFSDIRNFTSISEKLSPKDTFHFVSEFNKGIGPIISKNNGFINQYLGDGIVAIFPVSSDDALNAAIEMKKYQNELRIRNLENNKFEVEIGIGLHYGSIIMGIMGDEERLDATIISDNVNLAARIESLTKIYSCSILFSDAFNTQLTQESYQFIRYLGRTTIKGKEKQVGIFECLDYLNPMQLKLKQDTDGLFKLAVQLMSENKLDEALFYFNKILEVSPTDKTIQALIFRISTLK